LNFVSLDDLSMESALYEKLAIATGLGLLVGFQREWTAPHVAGVRTVTLITVLGAVAGLLSGEAGAWLIAAGLLSVAMMLVVGAATSYRKVDEEPGLTTVVAALVMYLVGTAVALDHTIVGVVVAGGTAVLLQWKRRLHGVVDRLGEDDVRSIIQLVLLAMVILPVLPNENYGPYGVLNPFEIWMIVVLIVGISVGGYIGYRFFGGKAGTLLSGVLGGLVSSTAITVSYARITRTNPKLANLSALVIMIASTIVFCRVLVEIAVVSPGILPDVILPILALMGLMALMSGVLFFFRDDQTWQVPLEGNRSQLKAAIVFGLLYAAVLFAVAAAKDYLGNEALYLVAALSGLTDMDAITLSTAQMVKSGNLEIDTGWRMIVTGALSNLVFKAAAVGLLGSPKLFLRVAIAFGVVLVGGVLLIFLWP
jgi:uncharacterized membrane protein (DUF4010 family)